ncbi:MAG: glycosyltransferase family 2 protein [Candidatus Omnitrophota bacterium]
MKGITGLISIIMPAYNEGKDIFRNIRETTATFDEFGCDYEIIVVDDGSRDETYAQLQRAAREMKRVSILKNMENFGKGRALKKGFRQAKGSFIVFLDSDMDLHPAQIQTFFDIMRLDEADVVIGSKRHPNSRLNYPWHRRIVSGVYFFFVKILFGLPIRDTQTGLKLFKRSVLEKVFPKILVKKFAYDLELLVLAHHFGYKVTEAPVVMTFQRGTWKRIGIRSIFDTWVDTLAVWYRMYILRYYDK